jgi:hypothetical protein
LATIFLGINKYLYYCFFYKKFSWSAGVKLLATIHYTGFWKIFAGCILHTCKLNIIKTYLYCI